MINYPFFHCTLTKENDKKLTFPKKLHMHKKHMQELTVRLCTESNIELAHQSQSIRAKHNNNYNAHLRTKLFVPCK